MKRIGFFFEPSSAAARRAFDDLPQRLAGHSVEWVCHPLPANDAQRAAVRAAWSVAPPGLTPGRWACTQLFDGLPQAIPDAAVRTATDDAADRRIDAARAHIGALADGFALEVEAIRFDGVAGLDAAVSAIKG